MVLLPSCVSPCSTGLSCPQLISLNALFSFGNEVGRKNKKFMKKKGQLVIT